MSVCLVVGICVLFLMPNICLCLCLCACVCVCLCLCLPVSVCLCDGLVSSTGYVPQEEVPAYQPPHLRASSKPDLSPLPLPSTPPPPPPPPLVKKEVVIKREEVKKVVKKVTKKKAQGSSLSGGGDRHPDGGVRQSVLRLSEWK
jgi:hypothetical protein